MVRKFYFGHSSTVKRGAPLDEKKFREFFFVQFPTEILWVFFLA